MHNMIIEDEPENQRMEDAADIEGGDDEDDNVEAFCAWREQIADATNIAKLRLDLGDHLWNRQGDVIN